MFAYVTAPNLDPPDFGFLGKTDILAPLRY